MPQNGTKTEEAGNRLKPLSDMDFRQSDTLRQNADKMPFSFYESVGQRFESSRACVQSQLISFCRETWIGTVIDRPYSSGINTVGAVYGTVKKSTTAEAVKCRMSVARCPMNL